MVLIGDVGAGKSKIFEHLVFVGWHFVHETGEVLKMWYQGVNNEQASTIECDSMYYQTQRKDILLMDTPADRSYSANMIGGLSEADVVISVRDGEFEAVFQQGGQTLERVKIAKTFGVKRLIVMMNKMDDPSVNWSEERYKYCRDMGMQFLQDFGLNPYCIPCSGLHGAFLWHDVHVLQFPWFRGPSLLEYVNEMPALDRNIDGPLRLFVVGKCKDTETYIVGRIERGNMNKNESYVLMPINKTINVVQITMYDIELDTAVAGEYVELQVLKLSIFSIYYFFHIIL